MVKRRCQDNGGGNVVVASSLRRFPDVFSQETCLASSKEIGSDKRYKQSTASLTISGLDDDAPTQLDIAW